MISPSELTQGKPIVLALNPDGTLIVPENLRQFFPQDVHGNYTFGGKYLEFGAMSDTPNPTTGICDVKMFATAVGPGMDNVTDFVPVDTIGNDFAYLTNLPKIGNDIVPAPAGLQTIYPGMFYPQGRDKIEQGKMTKQAGGPVYRKIVRPEDGENGGEKKKSLETLTVENGVIIIPKIKEDKDGKEDPAWTKSKADIFKAVAKKLKEHEDAGTKPENVPVMLCPEDKADSKKVQLLIRELRTKMFKDQGIEFIFVRSEERGLTKDQILYSSPLFDTELNMSETRTIDLDVISRSDVQSERTQYLVKQELDRRLPKFVMAPGKTPSDPKVKIMLTDIELTKLEEWAKDGRSFTDPEMIVLRRELAKRKKTPDTTEPEEPEKEIETVASPEKMTLDQIVDDHLLYRDVFNLSKVTPEADEENKSHAREADGTTLKENYKNYAESYKSLLEENQPELIKIKKGLRSKFNNTLKAAGIEPSQYGQSETWMNWDLAKQRYFAKHPKKSTSDYELADPFEKNVDKQEKLLASISNRMVGWEILQNPTSKFVKDLDSKKDKAILDLIAKKKDVDGQITLPSHELSKLGALVKAKLEKEGKLKPEKAPAAPGKLTPFLEDLKKNKKEFSFEKATNVQVNEIVNMIQKNKQGKEIKLALGEIGKGTEVFVLGADNGKGTVESVDKTTKKVTIKFDKGVKEIDLTTDNVYGRQKIEKYIETVVKIPLETKKPLTGVPKDVTDAIKAKGGITYEKTSTDVFDSMITYAEKQKPPLIEKTTIDPKSIGKDFVIIRDDKKGGRSVFRGQINNIGTDFIEVKGTVSGSPVALKEISQLSFYSKEDVMKCVDEIKKKT